MEVSAFNLACFNCITSILMPCRDSLGLLIIRSTSLGNEVLINNSDLNIDMPSTLLV